MNLIIIILTDTNLLLSYMHLINLKSEKNEEGKEKKTEEVDYKIKRFINKLKLLNYAQITSTFSILGVGISKIHKMCA